MASQIERTQPFIVRSTDIESFSQSSWGEIYLLAQQYVPFYLVAQTEMINSSGLKIFQPYDGISLFKYIVQSGSNIDPLTRLTIQKTHYFILKTLDFNITGKETAQTYLSFEQGQVSQIEITENMQSFYSSFLFIFIDSLNFYACDKSQENRKMVRKCQYIVSSFLPDNFTKSQYINYVNFTIKN